MEIGSKEFFKKISTKIKDVKNRHDCYQEVVEHAKKMSVHFYGNKPYELLEEYRPHEQQDIRDYRLKIWKPITKSLSDKIINTVNKILNPRYFTVNFGDFPSKLFDERQHLGNYLTQHYPIYGNIWNWIKETYLRKDFSDPNALICILPSNFSDEEDQTEMYKPIPFIYGSECVLDYIVDEYYLIFKSDDSNDRKGYVIYIDKDVYTKYYYDNDEFSVVKEVEHGFGEVPAFFCGGVVKDNMNKYYYESFVAGVQPHWDKVIEMTSDKDGVIVNHLYPERYEWQVECSNNGCHNGYVEVHPSEYGFNMPKGTSTKPQRIKCQKCEGTGMITSRSPYGAYTISANALNPDSPVPTPPVEYITKDIAPLTALTEEIRLERESGFRAINMEILNRVGENQSGVAKVIDRQDLDSFLLRISSHTFDFVLTRVMKYSAYWMYGSQLSIEQIDTYLEEEVKISKPVEFNVLSIDSLVDEYNKAKEVGANSNYLKKIESEIVNIKYARNEKERKKNLVIVNLKPFPDKTIDDLLTAKSMGSIREKDIILNENIDLIVDKAVLENKDFLVMDQSEQLEILYSIIEADYITVNDVEIPPIDSNGETE